MTSCRVVAVLDSCQFQCSKKQLSVVQVFPLPAGISAESLTAALGTRFLERPYAFGLVWWKRGGSHGRALIRRSISLSRPISFRKMAGLGIAQSSHQRGSWGKLGGSSHRAQHSSFPAICRACFNGSPGLPRGRFFHRPTRFSSSRSTSKNLLRGVMLRTKLRN